MEVQKYITFTRNYKDVNYIYNSDSDSDCDSDKSLLFIEGLPDEIKLKIYKEYFEPKILYDKYLKELKQDGFLKLSFVIREILVKPLVISYLCKVCRGFQYSYKSHKIDKKKSHLLLNNLESFTVNILIFTFH
jgi:hypothetical protein